MTSNQHLIIKLLKLAFQYVRFSRTTGMKTDNQSCWIPWWGTLSPSWFPSQIPVSLLVL